MVTFYMYLATVKKKMSRTQRRIYKLLSNFVLCVVNLEKPRPQLVAVSSPCNTENGKKILSLRNQCLHKQFPLFTWVFKYHWLLRSLTILL